MRTIICLVAALGLCLGQQVGSTTTETHPSLTTYTCTSPTSCVTQSRSVTMDANWRWLHDSSGSNCYSGNTWDSKYCADQDTCATSCYLEGSDYSGTYGVTTSSDALTLKLVTVGTYSTNVGSRLYLMASESKYEMFKVMNREFAFDVDVSNLPCGLNGALYFVEMDETGNMGVGNNKAGAKFGTGYCDGQCPHDVKFINGQANVINWTGTSTNSGKGKYGSCCGEMDIWEANSISTAFTPHNCDNSGLYRCSTPQECGDNDGHRYQGVCDKDGCDWNHYRMGNTNYYGPGMTVDTKSKFTVVTQFITSDGTDTGDLVEIRRYYRQNGVVIPNAFSTWSGLTQYDSVTDESCTALKSKFGDTDDFKNKGGMTSHGNMLKRGVVLVLSLWDDYDAYMLWLDSNYPTSGTATTPGVARGSCATTTGVPSDVEKNSPGASVIFSSIKVGPFGGTTADIPIPSTASSTAKTTTSSAGATIVSSAGAAVVSSTAAVVASSVEAAVVSSAGALSSNTESADESSHSISSASSLVATLATLAALRVAA